MPIPGVLPSSVIMVFSSFFFAILVVAKYVTNPQCFAIYYTSQTNIVPPNWNLQMVIFYVATTPLAWICVATVLAWTGIAVFIRRWFGNSFRLALGAVSVGFSPLLLLAFPALFWFDMPFTEWFIHRHYHDGNGAYPFWMFMPRIIGPITLVTAIFSVRFIYKRVA